MKILIATDKPFAAIAVNGIREVVENAGMELALLEKYTEKAQLLDAVKDVDAIIIRSDIIDNDVFDAAGQLKIVVRAGAGYDNVDLVAATSHNVCVMNTPGQNANAVAELALGMMVFGMRNMYNGTSGSELMGKKLGIHAYGNVGRNVAMGRIIPLKASAASVVGLPSSVIAQPSGIFSPRLAATAILPRATPVLAISSTTGSYLPPGAAIDQGFVPTIFFMPPHGGMAGPPLLVMKVMQPASAAIRE